MAASCLVCEGGKWPLLKTVSLTWCWVHVEIRIRSLGPGGRDSRGDWLAVRMPRSAQKTSWAGRIMVLVLPHWLSPRALGRRRYARSSARFVPAGAAAERGAGGGEQLSPRGWRGPLLCREIGGYIRGKE